MSSPLKFVVSAPGKVILFGEHSVVYGKPALAASIDKRTRLHFETTADDHLNFGFTNLESNVNISMQFVHQILNQCWKAADKCVQETREINQNEIKLLELSIFENIEEFKFMDERQRISILCVFVLLFRLFNAVRGIRSFKMVISTELMVGAGTGSSASFSVCLAAALWRFHQLLHGKDFKNGEFSIEDKKMINDCAFCCEQIIHGKASGVDNFVCTYGSIVKVISNDGKKSFQLLENPHQFKILLVNTGLTRNTANLVKSVSELHSRNSAVVDCVLNSMSVLCEEAESIINQLTKIDHAQVGSRKRLFKKLEDLISLNHGLLASLGVSNDVLDIIVNTTKKFELASKLTGAGGGGYAITLIPPFTDEKIVEQCKNVLQSKGCTVEEICIGTSGVDIEIL